MKKTFNEIAQEYIPYHTLKAFQIGSQDYMDGNYNNPYGDGYEAQAWDRGMEAAMRFTSQRE
jgi:hypothetical protein